MFYNYSATQYVHICVVDALEMTFFALKGPLRLSIYTDRAVCVDDCGQFYPVSKGAIDGFYGLILVCFCTRLLNLNLLLHFPPCTGEASERIEGRIQYCMSLCHLSAYYMFVDI